MIARDELFRLYVLERKTTTEIAYAFGLKSNQTVGNWLAKYGIPRRHGRDAQNPITPTRAELTELYVVRELSIEAIRLSVGSSEQSIRALLVEYGITVRDKAAKMGGWNKGVPLTQTQRGVLSASASARVGSLSPRYGVTLSPGARERIAASLRGRFRRHENPNWKNGGTTAYRRIIMSQWEYAAWRAAVYERDFYTCQLCRAASIGNIEAHHIHPVRKCPDRILDVSNGITLCKPCHKSTRWIEADFVARFEETIRTHLPTPGTTRPALQSDL